ncbi:Mitochondrial Rho GTPase 1 [Ranunculus cassubicifolius]
MTLLEPAKSLANLKYITYPDDCSTALRLTRKRRIDSKKQQSERNVFQCFVFVPKKSGKSALLNAFIKKPFSESYSSTTNERFAVNQVDGKTLILREIPEDSVKALLSSKESLTDCDVAVFVHDSSDELSWAKNTVTLIDIVSHGEATGFEVPCLIVAAKDDLDPYPATQDAVKVYVVVK